MRLSTLILAAATALAGARAAHAQKTIDDDEFRLSGRVVDKTTGAPVQTAVIRFEDLRRAVVADSQGRFVMERLPQGTHYAEIARLGYTETTEFIRIAADHDSLLIELEPQPLVLEAITAISDRLERRRNRSASMVRAFDTKRLATSTTDLRGFLTSNAAIITMCPAGRSRSTNDYCVISRGDYRPVTVYLNEMPFFGAPLDLYYTLEFELVEYYPSTAMVRLYTTAFLERVAKGKAFLDPTLN